MIPNDDLVVEPIVYDGNTEGVRVRHLPTDMEVVCTLYMSQSKNLRWAKEKLEVQLLEVQQYVEDML